MGPALLALPDHRIVHEQAHVFLDNKGPWDEKKTAARAINTFTVGR